MRWLLLLLFLPVVAAHGPPEVREIDTRVLLDGTQNFDYGIATQEDPRVLYEGGHDLLVLDMREGFDAARGGHIILWQLVMQFGDPTRGALREEVRFQAGGSERVITVSTTDNEVFEVAGADGSRSLDVGDAHVHGVEFWTTPDSLGVGVGDAITDIRVAGFVGASPADIMPGTYHLGGVLVPGDTGASGHWPVGGPAALFDLTIEGPWGADNGTGAGSLLLSSPLNAMGQFVTVRFDVDGNMTAPNPVNINLDPRGTRRVTFPIEGATPGDVVRVSATSDLDAFANATVLLDVSLPPAPTPTPTADPSTPGLPLTALVGLLAWAVWHKR